MRKPSKTNLTNAPWTILKPLIPPPTPGGRPPEVDRREVLNTLLDQARTGGPGELLPHDLLPTSTVGDSFPQGRDDGPWQRIGDALRPQVRTAEGRDPTPRLGDIDSPPVKGTEVGGERGDDRGQRTGGRKRPRGVDAWGRLVVVRVPAAAAADGATAPRGLGPGDRHRFARLAIVWGEGTSRNDDRDAWLAGTRARFRVAVVARPAGAAGFVKRPKRWVAERTIAWRGRDRRPRQDDEYPPASSTAWVQISVIGQRVRRLAPAETRNTAPFMYNHREAA